MKLCVTSPKITSKSARLIAENLNCDYVNPHKQYFNPNNYDIIINWGLSDMVVENKKVLNPGESVINCVDKLKTFYKLHKKVQCVPFTTDPKVVQTWIKNKNDVVCRKTTVGSKSEGTLIYANKAVPNNLDDFVLFTGYVHHKSEFRVNVVDDKIISVLKKTVNTKDNTFNFIECKDKDLIKRLNVYAKSISEELELNYFGFDILLAKNGELYLLEVNSAPALFGQYGIKFITALKKSFL